MFNYGSQKTINNFMARQQKLLSNKEELQSKRDQKRIGARRLLEMYPKQLEKSASRLHNQFLYGTRNREHVFKQFKRA